MYYEPDLKVYTVTIGKITHNNTKIVDKPPVFRNKQNVISQTINIKHNKNTGIKINVSTT